MIGRLAESWIPPDHVLDLRALVRLRDALVNERGEWQQRIQAVLYHHGVPQRRELLTRENRAWVEELPLPTAAREQVTVALAMIDAVTVQLGPLTERLRAYARRQAGCRALMAHYGIGELTAVVVLAELGDARRFSSSRDAVRYAGIEITVYQSDQHRASGHRSRQGRPTLRWALYEAAQPRDAPAAPTTTTTSKRPRDSAATAPASPSCASSSNAATTACANSATRHSNPRELPRCAPSPHHHRCAAAGSRHVAAATHEWTALNERAAATLPQRDHPINHHVADPQNRVADRDTPGHPRAHHPHHQPRTPTTRPPTTPTASTQTPHLTPTPRTDTRHGNPHPGRAGRAVGRSPTGSSAFRARAPRPDQARSRGSEWPSTR
jgi:hypothetical protein